MELISNFYLEHKSVFEENFKKALATSDAESIHKMRTSTKRLRALFELIGYLSEGKFKGKKQIKKLRSIFKQVGIIRELQIEQIVVGVYESNLKEVFQAYKNYLSKREKKEVKKVFGTIEVYTGKGSIFADRKVFKAINAIDPKQAVKKAKKFLEKKTSVLAEINSKPVSNSRIHQSRTVIKQIYYLYDLLSKLTGENKILNVPAARLRDVEQMIGNWHDLSNSQLFLNQFLKTKNGNNISKYADLKKYLTTERSRLRKEIVKIVRKEIGGVKK